MCKGDLPRRRERCHLREEDTESQGQMGDRGVGRDVGREQWCAGLRGHSISNSPLGVRNNPSRHTHTEQTCLPVTGHSRARFTPLPYCGFSQRPLPSTLPHLAVPCFGFPTIPPPIDDCIRATAAASQVAVPTAQLQDAKLLAPKSQAGLSSSSSCEQQQGMLCSGASSTLRKETSRA